MSLYALANADNEAILTAESDFGVAMIVTRPDGTSAELIGMAADIGLVVDPETGQTVSGRRAHLTLPLAPLLASVGQPVGVLGPVGKPWTVALQLPSESAPHLFKITETMPDRIGCIVCFLEEYRV